MALQGRLGAIITKLFQTRDELSFGNIRSGLWPTLLVFPLSIIMGNMRYYDHSIALAGFGTNEMTFFLLGLGWLILTFIPGRLIIPILRVSAIISASLIPFLIFMPMGPWRFMLYMTSEFFNGLNAACAFYMFCFLLNNIERLFGMALIQFYYGVYYSTWNTFPIIHTIGNIWGGAIAMAAFLVVVFSCRVKQNEINTDSDGKKSGVPLVIGLSVVHYMIMCMSNYIEWTENSISALAFGLGTFVSLGLVFVIQLFKGRSALYIWLMFLVLSLLGLGALLYDSPVTFISGSFAYGLGDSLGYIIICYMCAGAIKRSKSLKMFRLYCIMFFVEYFIISGLFSLYFNSFDESNKFMAFTVVLVLVSLCLLFMPLIQKRLFEADWTDGLYLRDMDEYSHSFAETETLDAKDHLNLTAREKEVFTMLLDGSAPKEIAHLLKISYETVHFHQKNLYRKLGIQSRAELFARYSEINKLIKDISSTNVKLKSLSTTDELTKLDNRRSLMEHLNTIWKQNMRQNLPVTLLMIDVDYFKKYNDSLGHLEGDKALIAIAKCMKEQVKRESDFIARFGGEEFVCVLPFFGKDEAFHFAEKLVQSVENMKLPHPTSEHSKYVTVSVGMAVTVPDNNISPSQLLDEADKALYKAKQSGRNRVVTA